MPLDKTLMTDVRKCQQLSYGSCTFFQRARSMRTSKTTHKTGCGQIHPTRSGKGYGRPAKPNESHHQFLTQNKQAPCIVKPKCLHSPNSTHITRGPFVRVSLSKAFAISIAVGLTSNAAHSEEVEDSPLLSNIFRVHGFGTLGIARTNSDDFGVISSFAQRKPVRNSWSHELDSVFGLQVDIKPLEDHAFVIQGLWRPGEKDAPVLQMTVSDEDQLIGT